MARASFYGKASSFGGARLGKVDRAPWGKAIPKDVGRHTNSVGSGNRSKVRVRSSGSRPTPDRSLFGMDYPANDPAAWPVMPDPATGRRGNVSTHTQAKVDFVNTAVNHAYQRAGYAG